MAANFYRPAAFILSIACYDAFLLTFLYLLAFLGNRQATPLADAYPAIRAWVPYSVDLGRDMGSPTAAGLVNLALLPVFGLQHTAMAPARVQTAMDARHTERNGAQPERADRQRRAGAADVARHCGRPHITCTIALVPCPLASE